MSTSIKKITSVLLLLSLSAIASADDIDIIDNKQTLANANILFVMDLSGSMNWGLNPNSRSAGNPSRLQVLRGAFRDIVADTDFNEVNFGLSVFSGGGVTPGDWSGAGVAHGTIYPVSPVIGTPAQAILSKNGFTHPGTSYMPATGTRDTRHYLSLLTNTWVAGGLTPIVGALFEASRYFRGESVVFGNQPASDIRSAHPSTYTGNVGGTAVYQSPITLRCPRNGIILLSDGAPTTNQSASRVAAMIGANYANNCNAGGEHGRCGPELAAYMANEDHADNIEGEQNVFTYTVGLALANGSATAAYLSDIATRGGGKFVNAQTRAELTAAFKQAVQGVASKARTFSAPTYSIDTSTLLTHGDFVYVPVFDRGETVWPGNLKKYKLVQGVLTDADDNSAVDATTGALKDTARDFWSSVAATDPVTSGGAANKINPVGRKIKTDDGTTMVALDAGVANADFDLGSSNADSSHKANLIRYIRGANPDGTARYHMGDIIHSKPVQLQIAGGRKVIFVGSNEGYLHAINDSDGTEAFAYMPKELLPNIDRQYSNVASEKHIYGVDGALTLWIDESYNSATTTAADATKVGNGVLDANERAILFFGLRRGGKFYYAVEVTNPDNPVLLWKKSFGTGDSWSQPVVAHIKRQSDNKPKPVIIVGGGFNDDSSGVEQTGGNAVYISDALTGNVIWRTPTTTSSAYAPDGLIENNVPSRIRVIDVDRNGSADRLYFGDTGGNIWRVDLNNADFNADTSDDGKIEKAKLYKFAKLGGTIPERKFFEEPDVAIFKQGGQLVASVAIGSGDRPNPLDTGTNDKFFVLYDKEMLGSRVSPTIMITDSGLKDSATLTSADTLEPSYKGWYKNLSSTMGEKVLSTAVTYQNKVLFTTFQVTKSSSDVCDPNNETQAKLYIMDIALGTEHTNTVVSSGEILGTPQIIFEGLEAQNGGNCVQGDCVRKEIIRVGNIGPITLPALPAGAAIPSSLPRVYWIDNEQ